MLGSNPGKIYFIIPWWKFVVLNGVDDENIEKCEKVAVNGPFKNLFYLISSTINYLERKMLYSITPPTRRKTLQNKNVKNINLIFLPLCLNKFSNTDEVLKMWKIAKGLFVSICNFKSCYWLIHSQVCVLSKHVFTWWLLVWTFPFVALILFVLLVLYLKMKNPERKIPLDEIWTDLHSHSNGSYGVSNAHWPSP